MTRQDECLHLLHACWLLKFASRSVFRKSLQGKGKGWYSLGCDDQEEAHWTSPIWQVPNWQVPSCTPKEWLQEDFSQENCSPEDHWSACLCSKAEGFQSSWIPLHCCTQAQLQLTSAIISFLADMCLTLSATAFLNSWNEIKWLCIVLWRGKIKKSLLQKAASLRISHEEVVAAYTLRPLPFKLWTWSSFRAQKKSCQKKSWVSCFFGRLWVCKLEAFIKKL